MHKTNRGRRRLGKMKICRQRSVCQFRSNRIFFIAMTLFFSESVQQKKNFFFTLPFSIYFTILLQIRMKQSVLFRLVLDECQKYPTNRHKSFPFHLRHHFLYFPQRTGDSKLNDEPEKNPEFPTYTFVPDWNVCSSLNSTKNSNRTYFAAYRALS